MSRATPDDQLKFLLSCVRYSNGGKIDFVEVARDCGVVSKGAAAKRYERLLKSNGINPNGGPTESPKTSTPTSTSNRQKSKAEIAKAAAAKRRKIEGDRFDFKVDDEDDYKPLVKAEVMEDPFIKSESDMSFTPYMFRPTTAPLQHMQHPVNQFSSMPVQHSFSSSSPSQYIPSRPPAIYQSVVPTYSRAMYQYTLQGLQPNKQNPIATSHPQEVRTITKPPSPVVSETQIQAMYDEFCTQDMFKELNFDASASAQASSSTSTMDSTATTNDITKSISPRTGDISADASTDIQLRHESNQDTNSVQDLDRASDGTSTDAVDVTMPEPTGKDVDSSILIID